MPTQTFLQWSQPYLYDNGSSCSVGISDNGTVLEVHNGPDGNDGMYYRVGAFTTVPSADLSSCIQWSPSYPNGVGDGYPISADVNDQFAVQVYQDSDKNLYFQWAPLPASAQGQLGWNAGVNYTSGQQPAIAMNGHSQVVAVHQDSKIFNYTLWYATAVAGGGIGGTAQILQPDGSTISGDFVQVAINDQGTVVVAYSSSSVLSGGLSQLYFIVGALQPDGSIVFGAQIQSLALSGGFDIDLDNAGHLLIVGESTSVGHGYLGWMVATVEGTGITFPPAMLLPFNFTSAGASVTVAMNNAGNLVAQTGAAGGPPPPFQHFVGQAWFDGDFSHWMGDNLSSIGQIPLNLLAIPGTHDSGTYPISPSSDSSPDNPSFLIQHAGAIATGWAQSQDLDFLAQLNAGIRYLDLRVCYQSQQNAYVLCHAFYGAPLAELFSDIRQFYQQGPEYAHEILLLDVNHVFTDSGGVEWAGPAIWMPGGPNGQFPGLCSYINSSIGDLLLPPSLNGKSLDEIIASPAYQAGGRVILFFDDTYSVVQNPSYWPNGDSASQSYWETVDGQQGSTPGAPPAIASIWPNVATLPALVGSLTGTLQGNPGALPAWNAWVQQKTRPTTFLVLQCIGTEGTDQVVAGLAGGGPPTLQSWEAGICSPALFWLSAQDNAVAANIVLVDWLEQTLVTPLCMALNQRKASALAQ